LVDPAIHTQPKISLVGPDPATYVFRGFGDLGGQDVDARNKSGQWVFTVASRLTPPDPHIVATAQPDSRELDPAIRGPAGDD
jgi:hypothetical protein